MLSKHRSNPLPVHLRSRKDEVTPSFTYSTFSPNVAAAFVAANILDFAYMEVERGKVAYVFYDPLRVGREKAKAYYEKQLPTVHAAFYSEIRGLFTKEHGRLLNDKVSL